ncbi:MAG: hypothetical protein M0R18_01680 [Deltaproteobacteria bacterium]|jgi:hypothetical protein|nr:hypothetical protein [Deltaproteobacteria bacterium]MDD3619056.1 hypothetical protein [Desulfobulbaceae bacterium]
MEPAVDRVRKVDKPGYLYHGSRHRLEILEPRQAIGLGGEADCRKAVYAVSVWEWAIAFAFAFVPTADDAVFSVDTETNPPRILLQSTDVEWDRKGYLYTLPSETFEQADDLQWVSYSPVKPLSVEEIDPRQYRAWIVKMN